MSNYVHITGWVRMSDSGPSGPIDPGWGQRPPVDPGFGGGRPTPPDPGYGRPDWAPGHPGGGPIYPGHPGNKPPGAPILPPSIDNGLPPMGGIPPRPWTPGHWHPVDPGFGLPPLWGFVPVDPGFGIPVTPPPSVGGGPITPPVPGTKPPDIGTKPPGGGQWVPTDPDWGVPAPPCGGGKPHPPIWAWIPDVPPDLSKPVEPVEPPPAAPK